MDISEKNERKIKWARLSILSNTLLVIFKFIVGVMSGSVSIISEGVHSSIDLVAAVVAWLAVRQSARPPDRDHAFGHGKVESISGTFEALLIFVAAILIFYEAIKKINEGNELQFLGAGIFVMFFSSIINYFVSQKLMKIAHETNSVAIEADAWHLRTDVYTSVGVFIGLFLIKITNIHLLDPIIAIFVAIVIIKAAYDLTKKSIFDLMDKSIDEEDERRIIAILKEHYSDFIDFHELRTRRSGPQIHVDLHLTIHKDASLSDAHDIADHLELEIKEIFPEASIIIHVEPCDGECEKCNLSCGKKDSQKVA